MAKKTDKPVEEENIQQLIDEEPVYDEKPLPALKRRHLWKRLRWLLWLLLLVPFIYLAVQIFIILAPRMRDDVVRLDSMTDSLTVTGQVVLESEPVRGGQGGHVYYSVPAGQRVTAEAEVARVFASEEAVQAMEQLAEVEAELNQLVEAQQTVVDGADLELLLGQMQSGLYSLIGDIELGNYDDLAAAKNEVLLAANRIQISTGAEKSFDARLGVLNNQKQHYESQAQAIDTITAPTTGYFTPSQKNDRVQMNFEEAEKLTPETLRQSLEREPRYYDSGVIGHIATDYRWYFYTLVDMKDSEKFIEGDKTLQLAFPDAGDITIPVTVQSVTEDAANDQAMVVLFSEYMSPEILSLRVERAEIVFAVKKGILIEKGALRLADFPNEDGTVSTFKGVYVKFGNMVYFRKIEILVEDDFYMLVPDEVIEGVNEVKLYDRVVMDSGGEELYDGKIL